VLTAPPVNVRSTADVTVVPGSSFAGPYGIAGSHGIVVHNGIAGNG
jgi:hypothetical protein